MNVIYGKRLAYRVVVQLVRTSACHAEGQGFDTLLRGHLLTVGATHCLKSRKQEADVPSATLPVSLRFYSLVGKINDL